MKPDYNTLNGTSSRQLTNKLFFGHTTNQYLTKQREVQFELVLTVFSTVHV